MKLSFTPTLDRWLKHKREPQALAWLLSILWLLLVGFLAFVWNLGSTGLVDETEPLFAEASRQMTVTGNWITPMFNGVTRFDKPILIYWCQAIAYRIFGVNEWAVRLPSALSAMGLVSLSFYTLWSFGSITIQASPDRNPRRGYWLCAGLGSAAIALNPHIMIWARTGVSDMLLTGCMDGALLAFFLGYAQPTKPAVQERWYLAFYVLAALAVLTKGPVGIVLPSLIISAFVLYLGNWRQVWREIRPLRGGLLFIGLVLPWYILVIQANGWKYINSFFGHHNLERFTQVLEHNLQPWYFYLLVILLGFAPWSVYLPVAIARLKFWQRHNWQSTPRSQHLGLFTLFWFMGVLSFFTIAATKLPSYVLPLMPAAAILVALMWSQQLTETIKSKYKSKQTLLLWSGWLNVVFLFVLAAALFYSPHFPLSDPAILNPRQMIQQSGLPVLAATIWMVAAVIMAVLLWYRQWWGIVSVNLLGFIAFLIFAFMPTSFLIDQARQLPLRQLTAIAIQTQQPGEPFFMVGFKKPSVVFYSHRPVTYFLRPKSAAAEIEKIALSQPQPPTLLILSHPQKLQQLGLLPSQYQNLGQAGTYQLIRIAKSRF